MGFTNMKKALKFTIETQTEENEIISICHLNEAVVALEISDVAKKMYSLNKDLFKKLNSTTSLIGGALYREEIKLSKQDKNRLGLKLLNKYEHRDVQIMSINFESSFMNKRQSILTKNGRRIDFDPSTLKYKKDLGPLDPQNLTYDDVKMSTLVCEMEEIQLFQDQAIKTYMIKDMMKDSQGLSQVAYRIEIKAETEFEKYLEFILDQLNKSINFLNSYERSATSPVNYNNNNLEFKDSFKRSILNQIGAGINFKSLNLGSNRIKKSEFGKAALNYYNASLLLSPNVSKDIYGNILKNLLPTSKTAPPIISDTIENFRKLYDQIKKEYNIGNKNAKSSYRQSKISSKTITPKEFVVATTERKDIEQETLGYNLFSEKQKGLNKLTTSSYRTRIGAEQQKYYPSMDVADDTNFMTSVEKNAFVSNANAPAFVTPANIVFGNKTITCSRGMTNIDVNSIREFRIAKSARASQANRTNYPTSLPKAGLSKNVMSDFNITISKPKIPILERGSDIEVDPLQDVKYYVGESSYFTTNNPEFIYKNFKNIMDREDKRIFAIVSDVIPATMLRKKGSIESMRDLRLSNKKSKIRSLVSERKINLEEIPPQIKSMMTKSFQNNPNIDPLKNRESRAIIDETQKNIFLVRAHTGFELDSDGFPDLNRPIIEDMNNSSLNGKPLLAKGYNYEVPELGIVKDKFMPTIYNNLLYIRG